jgi:hypothetical protein
MGTGIWQIRVGLGGNGLPLLTMQAWDQGHNKSEQKQ